MNIVKQLIKVNYTKGRKRDVDMIVIHVMEGDLPSDIKNPYTWFNDPVAKASAHYGIDRDDHPIRQWVEEKDIAWANGRVYKPTAALVRERAGINPNDYSISIENEGTGKVPPTPIQLHHNVELVKDISQRHDFPITRRHVVGHNEIFARKPFCPGLIKVDDIVNIARGGNVFLFKRRFRRGDYDKDVELLQDLFVRTGYMTQEEVDTGYGRFGPRTEKAFEEFLRVHGE